jgi:hypothetical protein
MTMKSTPVTGKGNSVLDLEEIHTSTTNTWYIKWWGILQLDLWLMGFLDPRLKPEQLI